MKTAIKLTTTLLAIMSVGTPAAWADSGSSSARSKKTLGLGVKAGFIGVPSVGQGAELFLNFGSSNQIVANYGVSSVDLTSSLEAGMTVEEKQVVRVDELKIEGSLATLQWRYFLGNSFYFSLGAGQRQINVTYDLRATSTESIFVRGKVNSTSLVGIVDLGNQWMWESGIYFGFDWIGLVSPISSKSKATTETGVGTLPQEFDKLQKDSETLGDKIGDISSVQLVLLNFGFAF